MRRPFAAVAVLGTAAAVFSLAGCGSSTSPTGSSNFKSLPQAEQDAFKTTAVEEVTADVESFGTLSPLSGFLDRVAPHRIAGFNAMRHAKGKGPRFQTSGCVTEGGNLTDEDNDGVYDQDSVTFNCTDTGSTSFAEQGFFAYDDPTPTTPDIDVDFNSNLQVTGNTSDGDDQLSLVGNSKLTQASGALDETGTWALDAVVTNQPQGYNGTFKLSANETATYTYGGANLTSFGNLPPGQFSINGNWGYDIQTTQVNVNLSFTVSTPQVLQVNRTTCTSNGAGIESGEVDFKFSDGTVVKALWSGCPATPSVTVS